MISEWYPCPRPPREWQMARPVDRTLDRRVDALLSDPDQMAAFRRRLGLLAHHEESAVTAPAVASDRGPA